MFTPLATHQMLVRQKSCMVTACRICQEPALYSYYGAIVCLSCKTFFRRHIQLTRSDNECRWDKRCSINLQTRRRCSSCRFARCLAKGMQISMIRCPRSKALLLLRKSLLPRGGAPPNTGNIWMFGREGRAILLAQLKGCFNECIAVPVLDLYLGSQSALPMKRRFRNTSVAEFYLNIVKHLEIFREKLYFFHSVPPPTSTHRSNLSAMCVLHHAQLLGCPLFPQSSGMIFVKDMLEFDLTFILLVLAVVTFSADQRSTTIQDRYLELAWTYLVLKVGDGHARDCFSRLIRCLLIS